MEVDKKTSMCHWVASRADPDHHTPNHQPSTPHKPWTLIRKAQVQGYLARKKPALQGYLAHKKQPTSLGPPQDPRHKSTVEC